jgi:hypothetical protein
MDSLPNEQLHRAVIRHLGRGEGAPLQGAQAPRSFAQRAAAELRRYVPGNESGTL